jgi:hypothetical protein
MVALRPHTPKHISWGGWSHYTDTSELVDGYGAQNKIYNDFNTNTHALTIRPHMVIFPLLVSHANPHDTPVV